MWHAWERGETCTGLWWESPWGKKPFERQRHRSEGGIRIGLRERGWEVWSGFTLFRDGDWWQALVNVVMNLWVLAPRS
jgi:hypothetical protein